MELLAAGLPPVSQEFLDKLDMVFRAPTVSPGYDKEAAMYEAGQRSVIEYIKNASHVHVSTGDPVKAQRAVVRLGS